MTPRIQNLHNHRSRSYSCRTVQFPSDVVTVYRSLYRSGLFRLSPVGAVRAARALRTYGISVMGLTVANASLCGSRIFLVDDRGELTFGEFDRRTDALACGLSARGLTAGDRVGILCRNHRYFLEAMVACAKLGVDTVLLNSDFAGPRTLSVALREHLVAVVADADLRVLAPPRDLPFSYIEGWPGKEMEALMEAYQGMRPPPPPLQADQVILTSGTTGEPVALPRVALERQPGTLAAILDRVGMRVGDPILIAVPLFHAWGFGNLILALVTRAKVVLRRKFNAEDVLRMIEAQQIRSAVIVPVMAQRLLKLTRDIQLRYDLTTLHTFQSAGARFEAALAEDFQDAYGERLVNVYGSTEVGGIAYAVPSELRGAPGTAGRPLNGTEVSISSPDGWSVPNGVSGEIRVRRRSRLFGSHRDSGWAITGDVGYIDPQSGLLFVSGRRDEMVICGGENVYPSDVERVLASHPDIEEAAITAVPDLEFGTRLAAWVVARPQSQLDEVQVRDYVRRHSARYHVPRDVTFLAALPRNAAGKVVARNFHQK